VPVLFRTGSAHGIHPSERSPSGRLPRRFRRDEPTYRLSCPFTSTEVPDRPGRPRFLGSYLPEVPCVRWFFKPTHAGSSLGFHPSRAIPREPCTGISPGLLSRASQTREQDARINLTACTESTGAPESRSALAWLSPDVHRSARRKKLPSWGLRTCPYPDRSDFAPPGLLSSPCTGSRITVDSPVRFGR
jgi:hypothetical protein